MFSKSNVAGVWCIKRSFFTVSVVIIIRKVLVCLLLVYACFTYPYLPHTGLIERYVCTLLISIRIKRYEQHPTSPFFSHVFIRTLDMYTQDNLDRGLNANARKIKNKNKG